MRFRSMADGTVRFEVDVEPSHAMEALQLFGRPGAPVALAALTEGYAAKDDTPEPAPEYTTPEQTQALMQKGGALSKLAGQWCHNDVFQAWMQRAFPFLWNQVLKATPNVTRAEAAAEVIRKHCRVDSRAKLDHDRQAAEQFNISIRQPFSDYLVREGYIDEMGQ
jgi:hypothetical protein